MEEKVDVECYSGYKYAQEPRAFTWRGRRYAIQAVERAWRTPEGPHFLVRTEEGDTYELVYNETEDEWGLKEVMRGSIWQMAQHSRDDSEIRPQEEDQR